MAIEKDSVRAKLGGGPQGHGGMHAEFAGFVRRSRNHATLVALPAHNHGLAFQRRIAELLDRDEELVHINVKDDSQPGRHGLTVHQNANHYFVQYVRLAPSLLLIPFPYGAE